MASGAFGRGIWRPVPAIYGISQAGQVRRGEYETRERGLSLPQCLLALCELES